MHFDVGNVYRISVTLHMLSTSFNIPKPCFCFHSRTFDFSTEHFLCTWTIFITDLYTKLLREYSEADWLKFRPAELLVNFLYKWCSLWLSEHILLSSIMHHSLASLGISTTTWAMHPQALDATKWNLDTTIVTACCQINTVWATCPLTWLFGAGDCDLVLLLGYS